MGGPSGDPRLSSKALQDDLQKSIDELGFGFFQLITLACTGGVMMSEGSEMLVMGSITKMLDKEWGLSNFVRGFMVSVVFVGFALGNLISGSIGDRYGRRPTILLAYIVIGVAGFLTSEAPNEVVMVCLRFVVGLGCGLGFPSVYTLIPEICPTKMRGAVGACMIGFMPLGELYAAFGVFFIDKELEGLHTLKHPLPFPGDSWRRLCQYSAAPSFLFFGICLAFLQESPFFLAQQGRLDEMNAVIETMGYWNCKAPRLLDVAAHAGGSQVAETGSSPVARPDGFSWSRALKKCLGPKYLSTTLVMFCAHFTKDFSVFGLNYVFPQYFHEMSGPMSVGLEMILISLIALPGVVVAVGVTQATWIGNISSLSGLAFFCGLICFGLLHSSPTILHSVCAPLVKFLALAYFIITVVYTAEVFPTSVRNSAVGLCTSAGRLGSISAPLVFELSNGFDFFWCVLTVSMWSVAALARSFLTMETKGLPLADGEPLTANGGGTAAAYGTMARALDGAAVSKEKV